MKNKCNRAKNEKGITLAEVLICVVIVALVVGPMTLSFTTSTRNRVTAERTSEATNAAENLINDIETQITKDIILYQKVRGNRVVYTSLSEIEKYRHYYANIYLDKNSINTKIADIEAKASLLSTTDKKEVTNTAKDLAANPQGIFGFLNMCNDTNIDLLKNKYNMDQYAYEVIIWPLSKAPLSGLGNNELKVNSVNIGAGGASRFYSDVAYNFDVNFYNKTPVTFEINKSILQGLVDTKNKYHMASEASNFTILNTLKLKFEEDTSAPATNPKAKYIPFSTSTGTRTETVENQSTKCSVQEIKAGSKVVGFEITVETDTIGTPPTLEGSYYISMVDIDITGLLRNMTLPGSATLNPFKDYTFKIINKTSYNQVVRVIKNDLPGDAPTNMSFIASNDSPTATTENSVQFVNDITTEENYIIAVIVREKNPVIGEEGKIIKKMFDIYSYDPAVFERR